MPVPSGFRSSLTLGRLRLQVSLCLLALFGVACAHGSDEAQAEAEAGTRSPSPSAATVQSLQYGVTLFHYYQQDYFAALTELMAARQLQQLGVHDENAELLRGGMSLSYGMDEIAEQIFRDLLSDSSTSVNRDQAWFYLAKITWQRGQLQRAGAALAQLSPDYRGPLREEADFLRASIGLRQGDERLAASYLEVLPQDSPWRYYLYYNLGAAQAAHGDWRGAVDYFSQFEPVHARTPESKALRDKALTAAGFARMAQGQFEQAAKDFTRVRLDSPLVDRALLGYGWAASERGDYLAALSPWQQLGERSLMSASVRESLLAVPYAYEQLGSHGTALARYRAASEQYQEEQARVELAIEVFRSGDLRSLLGLGEGDGRGWLFDADILPEGEYAPYLRHLVSRHSFQLALRELRDLYRVAWHLANAGERLQVLAQVDADQQRSWSTVDAGNRLQQLQQRQQQLQTRVEDLHRRVDAAGASGDGRLLADVEQQRRWERLERATALAGDLEISEAQAHQLQLYRGLLIWEDSENYPARVWQVKRELEELGALEQATAALMSGVDEAVGYRREARFATRIATLQRQVQVQDERVQQTLAAAQLKVRQVAVAELESQSRQLAASLGQSRLAVARLYDLASPEVPR
jgi:tetratricopeptide (TPR) repeat protein